jgi:hypothetical protein
VSYSNVRIFSDCCWRCHAPWWQSHATHIKTFIEYCNSAKFDWININTISMSLHAVTCLHLFVTCYKTVEMQERLSTSAKCVHCRTLHGISFLFNFSGWVQGYIYLFSYAKQIESILSGEPFPVTKATLVRDASNRRKGVNARIAERRGNFQYLI